MTARPHTDLIRSAARHRPYVRMLAAASIALAFAGASLAAALHADAAAPPVPTGWTQTFLDDFDGSSLNGGTWRMDAGTSYPGGPANFGTGEVETSTAGAVSVANGAMSITARGQGTGGWTAARV